MPWRGELALQYKYPRLLEYEMLVELLEDLEDIRGSQVEDVWWWRLEDNGIFTVKIMYTKLERVMLADDSISDEAGRVLSRIWKSDDPSKIAAFAGNSFIIGSLLHNRLPTKANLSLRQVLSPDVSLDCVMCEGELELANHLFLHCDFARKVWGNLMRWLGLHFFDTA